MVRFTNRLCWCRRPMYWFFHHYIFLNYTLSSDYFSRSVADTSVGLGWTRNPSLSTSPMEVPWREVSVHRPNPEARWHDRMQPVAEACIMSSLALLHPGFSHRPSVPCTCGETHNPIFPEFNFRTINPASVGGVDQYYFSRPFGIPQGIKSDGVNISFPHNITLT
jgi:hypothetical protein